MEILGDGKQEKSYLHVSECVDAILFAIEKSKEDVNIFNIGSEDTISATGIGKVIVEEMELLGGQSLFIPEGAGAGKVMCQG